MPVYFATPTTARAGVVAGFVLSGPVYWGVPEAGGGTLTFTLYVANVTFSVPTRNFIVATGFVHYVSINGRVYEYVQENLDTVTIVATALANLINAAGDPDATAAWSSTGITLTPRGDTGANIPVAVDGMYTGTLIELVGNNLIPAITLGVLFAQGTMYCPLLPPTLPAAPASQQSWLFYSTTAGWYWRNVSTPTVGTDAVVGWVRTNATQIVAFSSRRIGTGGEAVAMAGGPAAQQILSSASGDTGPPGEGPVFGAATFDSAPLFQTTPGMLWLGDVAFATDDAATNLAGVFAITFLLYFINELVGAVNGISTDMLATDTSLTLPPLATLPVSSPQPVTFTFYATTHGLVTIGPGYAHNITIGTASYTYVQLTADTALTIAAAMAALIQESLNENAMALAVGSTVVLTPLQSTAVAVSCTASDGNAPATLTETQPSYYLIGQEIVDVLAPDGSVIVRGCKGSTAAAHTAGAFIWQVFVQAQYFSFLGAGIGWVTSPTVYQVPFAGLGLVCADAWATNEWGDSPITENAYAIPGGSPGGRLRGLSGGELDLTVSGVLAIGADQCPIAIAAATVSIASVTATVKGAPVGAGITVTVSWGFVVLYLNIAAGAFSAVLNMTSTQSVDGLRLVAGTAVVLSITAVGTTYAGNDLTVAVRF